MYHPSLEIFLRNTNLSPTREYAGSLVMETNVIALLNGLTPLQEYYPPFQREIDLVRIHDLVEEQKEEYTTRHGYGITHAPIILGHCEHMCNESHPSGIYLIDGNHRLNVFAEIYKFAPHLRRCGCSS